MYSKSYIALCVYVVVLRSLAVFQQYFETNSNVHPTKDTNSSS